MDIKEDEFKQVAALAKKKVLINMTSIAETLNNDPNQAVADLPILE